MVESEATVSHRSPRAWARVGVVLLVVAIMVPPLVANSIELTRLSRLIVLVLAVLGVNVLTGYTGLISLGQGVFVGVGAFAMANFIDWGLPLVAAALAATVFTGCVGIVLGLPALRVRGLYLALITFGFALAFPPLVRRLGPLTGGVNGRNVDNTAFVAPGFLGVNVPDHIWRYGVCIVVVGVWFVIVGNLVRSRIGRAIRSIRDNEAAAATFGINVSAVKAGSFAVSAAMTGTAGALQAILNPYLGSGDYDAFLSLRLYASAVVGGLGTLVGSVLGVVALIAVPWINDVVGLIDNEGMVFGAGLIIVTFFAPNGIASLLNRRETRNVGRETPV